MPNQRLCSVGCLLAVIGTFWCVGWAISDFTQYLLRDKKRLKALMLTCVLQKAISTWLIFTLLAESLKYQLSAFTILKSFTRTHAHTHHEEKKTIAFSVLVPQVCNVYKRSVRDGAILHFLIEKKKS